MHFIVVAVDAFNAIFQFTIVNWRRWNGMNLAPFNQTIEILSSGFLFHIFYSGSRFSFRSLLSQWLLLVLSIHLVCQSAMNMLLGIVSFVSVLVLLLVLVAALRCARYVFEQRFFPWLLCGLNLFSI